ncbi:MAG: hypothetical protein M0R17_05475 [Candidatus Omnitrophica bacterium]|jgi:hypothetical protein|nr:hypothetical protein [Candidatus Omnitrophota bacterium]
MNWYKNNISTSSSEGIDLRQELNWILYGRSNPPRSPKGHWVVYRRYDQCSKSEFYSTRTHEGVGGPAYNFTDVLLRTRRVPSRKRADMLTPTKLGADIGDTYNYYFEYTVNPKMGDHIIEIDWPDHSIKPTDILSLTFTCKYLIKRVHDYRLDNGNLQYYIISCDYDEVNY